MDPIDRELRDLIGKWERDLSVRQDLGVKLAAAIGHLARIRFEGVDVNAVETETHLGQMQGWNELVVNARRLSTPQGDAGHNLATTSPPRLVRGGRLRRQVACTDRVPRTDRGAPWRNRPSDSRFRNPASTALEYD
jgi:hypothetical protein